MTMVQNAGRWIQQNAVALWREAWRSVRPSRRRWPLIILLAAIPILLAIAWLFDHELDGWFVRNAVSGTPWKRAAGHLRFWGRGLDSTLFFSVLLLGAISNRRRAWIRIALACALATLFTATTVNLARVGTGRARPRSGLPDQFHGPTTVYRLQSFPSGHTAVAFSSATALLVTVPPLGIPAIVSAGAVGWASLYTRNHYLSDVLTGMLCGVWIGAVFGLAARRLNRDASSPGS